MTICKCGKCGKSFKTKEKRKKHRIKYAKGSCVKRIIKKEVKQMKEIKEVVEEKKPEIKLSNIKVPKISMPEDEAKKEWKKYCEILKTRKDKYLKVMKQATYHMKKGKELIDVYVICKKFGLNKEGLPRIAISRADIPRVYFEKRDTGTGRFNMETGWNRSGWNTDIELPQKTYDIHWERKGESEWDIKNKEVKTNVPRVPVELMPDGDLKNYYILWEVKEWEEIPPAKDPLLLKRISENLFVILGAWDVTPLEQSIMRGLK